MPIDPAFAEWLRRDPAARAFLAMREGRSVPVALLAYLGLRSLVRDPFLWMLRNYPGGIGMKLREAYYRLRLRKMGRCVLLDEGVRIDDPRRVSISDFVWIDRNVALLAGWGSIDVGRRVHVAENVMIVGGGGVEIGDYAAVARGASLYSHSEAIEGGKRLSGPMIPEEFKGMKTAPIRVGKDALVGVNALVLPGVTIGEGAIVGANSVVNRDVRDWQIVYGTPARPVATRPRVNVPDI